MYIYDGHAIGPTSVYTMKYLALAAALHLSAVTPTLHATGYDAKSVINNIPGSRRKLSHLHKDHHYLLSTTYGRMLTRKPKKDSRGCYGLTWIEDVWGNYIADRVAEDDLLFHGR